MQNKSKRQLKKEQEIKKENILKFEEEVEKNKKVPEDISIGGFDGIKQCEYCVPRLTTISQNNHEFARRGVKDLIDRIENSEKTSVSDIVPFALIQRASVRKI